MRTIIVMGGSFNPPTMAHLRLMRGALDEMRADMGIFVPSPHGYVKAKMRRMKHPEETLPEALRLRMLEAMAADDPRMRVDDCECRRTEKGYTYETMVHLQQKYPDARLYFLAGGDKVNVIARWHRIGEFLEQFHILVVRREGDDPEAALAENPFLSERRHMFHVIPAPEGLAGISSSAVRDGLRSGEPVEGMLHPRVWALLQENAGGMQA